MIMKENKFFLDTIEVSEIEPNLDNPRGPGVRNNDAQFTYLMRSIKELGLLVPLVVQEIKRNDKKYRLIDGERRYYALKELGIRKAPANIITNDVSKEEVKNIMFHIHTTRLQWDAFQQCKALEPLYNQLKQQFNGDEREVERELVEFTGTNKRTMNDRLNFLRWPANIKKMIYDDKPGLYWTIAEIEEGIIKRVEKNFPEYFNKVSKDDIRKKLLDKYLEEKVHAATEARKFKCVVSTPKEYKEQHDFASDILDKLVKNVDYTFEDAREEFLVQFPEADASMKLSYKRLRTQLQKVTNILKDSDTSLLFGMAPRQEKAGLIEILKDLESALEIFITESKKQLDRN
jgi:ParB/RepB/Spo0J family partition protein